MNSKSWVVAAALLSAGVAQATCYSVFRSDGALILESSRTPVNLALPLGDTVPEKFGDGASMTMSGLDVYCKDRNGPGAARKAASGKRARTAMKQEPANTAMTQEPARDAEEVAATAPESPEVPPARE